jgi:hypothetical protein
LIDHHLIGCATAPGAEKSMASSFWILIVSRAKTPISGLSFAKIDLVYVTCICNIGVTVIWITENRRV